MGETVDQSLPDLDANDGGLEERLKSIDDLIGRFRPRQQAQAQEQDPEKWEALFVAEDYGQGVPFPFYGFRRPQGDYFNSNLMNHLFVIADMSRKDNRVLVYDERCMGKGCDALCSLRLKFHMESMEERKRKGLNLPEVFISVRDNCVGQNKSNATMQFDCFLSLSFYKRVLILYLIPGHSHMMADRVVAWAKGGLKHKDIFIPAEMVNAMNSVKSIRAEYIDHKSRWRECWKGWKDWLGKYIQSMPVGFTGNYVFEFHEGKVTMKHLFNDDDDGITVPLVTHHETTGKAMWQDLFGTMSTDVSKFDVRLPTMENIALTASKVQSIAKKYECIPEEHRHHYPDPVDCCDSDSDCLSQGSPSVRQTTKKAAKKRKRITAPKTPGVPQKKRGRPKNAIPLDTKQKTILMMFSQGSSSNKLPAGKNNEPMRNLENVESDDSLDSDSESEVELSESDDDNSEQLEEFDEDGNFIVVRDEIDI